MNDRPAAAEAYRADVDGLRAIAVLAVILFHLDQRLLPGGFLGVDIFFVISGFLITRNIAQEIERGRFSIVEFYRRRVKRIAPAMLVVVAVTLAFSQWLMLPEDARETSKSAVWSIASMANVYFWRNTDTSYFAADSTEVPLLHLWSLGVEEQFYLIWPLALLLFYRAGRTRPFAVVVLAIAFGSFVLAEMLFANHPAFVYYMLPTRAGELMVGALVAVAIRNGVETRIRGAFVPAIAATGGLSVALSLGLLTPDMPLPGALSLAPTAGAAALILAGHCRSSASSRLLALRPLVAIGLISYSAYLWHWPLLALYRYGFGVVTPAAAGVLVLATMALAAATWRFVEQPARRSRAPALRLIARQYLVPAAGIMAVALATLYPARLGIGTLGSQAYQARLSALREQTRPALLFDWACQRQRLVEKDTADERCVLGADSSEPPRAILWGDSNATHYIGMLTVFAKEAGFRFRNIEVGSCPPLASDPAPYVKAYREVDCRASLHVARPVVDRFPVVILASTWTVYQAKSDAFLPAFFDTARALAAAGKLVILMGKVPPIGGYDRRCREKALSYPLLACPDLVVAPSAEVMSVNARLRRFAEQTPNVRYFDPTSYLCPDGLCRAYDSHGAAKYYDQTHLTSAESTRLGLEIVASEGVPAPFRLIARWPDSSR